MTDDPSPPARSGRTTLHLRHEYESSLPDGFDDDPRTPASYVDRFLRAYTQAGDRVFDPFAGFATTLRVAERLDREAYGIEFDADRVAYARDRLAAPDRLVAGDALDETCYEGLPPIDCCLTSPPYMVEAMRRDPLTNYDEDSETRYEDYLDDIQAVFGIVDRHLRPDGTLLVDVSNMAFEGRVTTLAWDVADRLRERFRFAGEVVVTWEGAGREDREGSYGYGYDHSYCLVFDVDG
jgi:DNA modification methylase